MSAIVKHLGLPTAGASLAPARGPQLEVALPLDVLKERLAFCREPVPEAAAGDGGVERL
ncbi:hypothetical protein [Archangium violaceum]|uniref:hypothetical protein n=1 Tax=Archangium violaceum TaxID=83451 RepID=UPI0037BF87AE